MAGLTSFYAVLLLATVASVAARSHHLHFSAATHATAKQHAQGPDDPFGATKVPVGTKFQLSILEEDGVEQYLYSEGEKVLKTSNPDSVGTLRTIWESVPGIAPRSIQYVDAFAIKNSDTGFTLLYDGQFYGEYIEGSPLAGWKFYQSPLAIFPPLFSLVYLPHSNGAIPGSFHYKPIAIQSAAVAAAARVPHQLRSAARSSKLGQGPNIDPFSPSVLVPEGTRFQLSILEDGEEQYLYSEGERVLKTRNPDSVGTARTIWESVPGVAPRTIEYINAFAIKNSDTGYTLLYNGEFYGAYSEGIAVAGWKLYLSPLRIYPQQYYLAYLPYSNGNAIPGVFYYKPLVEAIQTVVA